MRRMDRGGKTWRNQFCRKNLMSVFRKDSSKVSFQGMPQERVYPDEGGSVG
jgi:hypothetical protein